MAGTITQHPSDTPKTVEDKVRNLPANQGKNHIDMWLLIDTEVAQSRTDGKLVENQTYVAGNKHGSK